MRARLIEYGIHCALLVGVLAVMFPGTFLRGEIAMPGELIYKYAPWNAHLPEDAEIPANWLTQDVLSAFNVFYLLVEDAFERGEWPLWNHMQFMGAPLLANYQTAVFYPPRLVHRIFDLQTATTLFMLLKFFLCGMTAYICGRGLGFAQWPSRFFSLGWMLCLYNVTWCYWPLPDVSAWLPLMFLAIEFLLNGRFRRGYALLALSATLFMLAGHPETALTMAAFLGLYFFLRLALDRKAVSRKLLLAAIAWAVVLLVCAPQLLPFLEYLPNSFTLENRPRSDEGTAYALPYGTAILFWIPRFFGMFADGNYWADAPANSNYSAMFYVGVTAWMLAAVGIAAGNRKRALCLGIPALLSVLLVLDSPLAGLVKSLPLLNATRSGYFAGFGLFAVLILAAEGMNAWFSRPRTWRDAYPAIGVATAIAFGGVAFYFAHIMRIHEAGVSSYVLVQVGLAALFSLAGAVIVVVGGVRVLPPPLAAAALVACLAADLFVAGRGIVPTSPREHFFPDTELTRQAAALEKPSRIRILPMFRPAIPPGFVAPYGIEQFHGYDAIVPARFMHYISMMANGGWAKMSRVCAVDEIWLKEGVPIDVTNPELVGDFEGIQVYREPDAFERAFLVGRARAIPDWKQLVRAPLAPEYDPATEIIADWLPEGELPNVDSAALGAAKVTRRTANTVVVEVDAAVACYLVLADAYFPGWEADVDGARADVFPAYHQFRGIVVPEGAHTVTFEYRPRSFQIGLWISAIALAIHLFGSALILIRTTRK